MILLLKVFIYISKVTVKDLHVEMDGLQASKFIIIEVNTHDKEEPDVTPINKLVIAIFDEIAELAVPGVEESVDIHGQLALFFLVVGHIPLVQTRLTDSVLDKKIVDHL